MNGYVSQTLLTGKVFTIRFVAIRRGWRNWLAMQFVGAAVTLAGDLRVEPGDATVKS